MPCYAGCGRQGQLVRSGRHFCGQACYLLAVLYGLRAGDVRWEER